MIVCHIADGSYLGTISWLCNPAVKSSAHFVVAQDGRVTQLVAITDTAWCNGTSDNPTSVTYTGNAALALIRNRNVNANLYTISIEHEGVYEGTHGELTEKQLAATIDLIAFIRAEVKRLYGIVIPLDREHIVGHYQITPLNKPHCPGERFQFDAIIAALKAKEAVVTDDVVRKWCSDQGLIGYETSGDTPVTYRVLRWFIYKYEHRKV